MGGYSTCLIIHCTVYLIHACWGTVRVQGAGMKQRAHTHFLFEHCHSTTRHLNNSAMVIRSRHSLTTMSPRNCPLYITTWRAHTASRPEM